MQRALLAAAVLAAASAQPETCVIKPGVAWYDTNGNRIYAGGANMYFENGKYYIVGEGKKVHSDCSECFNQYSSPDLATWTFEGCVLKNEDIVAPPPYNKEAYYRMERPKIFKCPGTGKWIMYFHCDTSSFQMKSVGVLTADAITGPYTFAAPCFKPDGQDSYDMGTYVDDPTYGGDGKAYLIRSVRNTFAGISQMTADCLNVTGIVSQGPDCEGQAIMRDTQGVLHVAGSHLTGWASNAAQFVTSPDKTLVGAQWQNNYNPSGDPTTWDSQSTFIFPYRHPDGHVTFIWMADRWNANGPGGLDNMTAIWLPMIAPTGPAPPNPKPVPGWTLQLATCNTADPLQGFTIAGNTVKHTSSGLCVAQPTDGGENLALATCGATDGSQTWYVSGTQLQNTTGGNNCVDWNNINNVLPVGNAIIAYACGSWNAQWVIPNGAGTIEARDSNGKGSGMCAAVASGGSNPTQWSLPWKAAWSLKDY